MKFCQVNVSQVSKLRGNWRGRSKNLADESKGGQNKNSNHDRGVRKIVSFAGDIRKPTNSSGRKASSADMFPYNFGNGNDLESQHLLATIGTDGGGRRRQSYGDLNSSQLHTVYNNNHNDNNVNNDNNNNDDNGKGDNGGNLHSGTSRRQHEEQQGVSEALLSMLGVSSGDYGEHVVDSFSRYELEVNGHQNYLWYPSHSGMVYVDYTQTPDNSAGWVRKNKVRMFKTLGRQAFIG